MMDETTGPAPIPAINRNPFVESPGDVPALDNRRGRVGCPCDQVELKPFVEDISYKLKQVAIQTEIVSFDHIAFGACVMGIGIITELDVGVSELTNVPCQDLCQPQ
jgi:hypothetical protein